MADNISISLNNIRNVKDVYIEDLKIAVKVRRLGAGEELDLSDKLRRLNAIIVELQAIDFSSLIGIANPTKEQQKEIKAISKKAEDLTSEINEIKRFELQTYKRCFTDDKNGENVELLLNSLSDEDRGELFRQIFNPKVIEAPSEPVSEAEEKADA